MGISHMQMEGFITAGEFGTALHQLFDPASRTAFSWDRVANLAGQRVYVFKFRVPRENGTEVIERDSGRQITVAYAGHLFVDASTLAVVRIDSSFDLPASFPVRRGESVVVYQPVEIAGKSYNLPVHSETRVEDATHEYINRIDFGNYHKFTAESTIHYDGESPR
jgi:hypothetical protein